MTIDIGIACQAKAWANHLAETDTFAHAPNDQRADPPTGENLSMYYPAYHGPTAGEEMWYAEEADYDYSTGLHKPGLGCTSNFDPNCPQLGHFTQLVWDQSTKLGCGATEVPGQGGKTYLVCRYNTPGNYMGAFKEHVHCPKSGAAYGEGFGC